MLGDEDGAPKSNMFARPSDDELHRLSVDELENRIIWLKEEIERTKLVLSSKAGAFTDAEAVFKK